jgi:hypothetical protein
MNIHYAIEPLSRELKQVSVLLEEMMLNSRKELTKRLPMLPIKPLNQNTINTIKQWSNHMLDHDKKAVLRALSIYLDVRYAHSLCLNLSYNNFLIYAEMLKRSSEKICRHPNFIRAKRIAETHKNKHPKENALLSQMRRSKYTNNHPLVVVDNYDFLAHLEKRAKKQHLSGLTINPAKQNTCGINSALTRLKQGATDFLICGPLNFACIQEALPKIIIIYFRSRNSMNIVHKFAHPAPEISATYLDLEKDFFSQPIDSTEKTFLRKNAGQTIPIPAFV